MMVYLKLTHSYEIRMKLLYVRSRILVIIRWVDVKLEQFAYADSENLAVK